MTWESSPLPSQNTYRFPKTLTRPPNSQETLTGSPLSPNLSFPDGQFSPNLSFPYGHLWKLREIEFPKIAKIPPYIPLENRSNLPYHRHIHKSSPYTPFPKYLSMAPSFSTHSLLASLEYKAVTKKKLTYSFHDLTRRSMQSMTPLSYGVCPVDGRTVVTQTADGRETQNTANTGDIIMSGINREKYVIRAEKFLKLYIGRIGGAVQPEQTPRMVARYTGNSPVTFKAPWGEDMVLKPGDYVVREADGKGFYRIAKKEYEATYNPL